MSVSKFSPLLHRRFVVNCTTRCNFNCLHCIRQILDNHKSKYTDLPLSLFKQCLREFKKINYRGVAFTGGEPILHPNFGRLVEATAKENFSFSVVSNGWLYREYFSILRKYHSRLLSIAFSLDGSKADIHDKIRNKPGSYERVIEAIKFYKNHRFPVVISTCFNRLNLPDIENIYKLLISLKVDSWRILGVQQIRNKNLRYNNISTKERLFIWQRIIKLRKKIDKNFSLNINFCTTISPDIFPPDINFCRNLSNFEPAIFPDGSMMFCCDIYKECSGRPYIKNYGFWPSFQKNLKITEELRKQRLKDILKKNFFDGFDTCNYCNKYIEEIFRKCLK